MPGGRRPLPTHHPCQVQSQGSRLDPHLASGPTGPKGTGSPACSQRAAQGYQISQYLPHKGPGTGEVSRHECLHRHCQRNGKDPNRYALLCQSLGLAGEALQQQVRRVVARLRPI